MFQVSSTDVLYDHLNLGLVFLEDDRIVECNSSFEKIMDTSSDSLIGQSFESLLSAESVDLLADALTDGSESFTLTVQKNVVDEVRWLKIRYKENPEYTPCLRLFIVEDVTSDHLRFDIDKIQIEQRLDEERARYRNLLDSAFEAKIIYDSKNHAFLDVNKAACDLFGYTREEFLGIDPMAVRTPYLSEKEARDHLNRSVKQALIKGTFVEETHSTTKQELVLETEITLSPLDNEKGEVVMSIRDITSRKKAERELENYRSHLEQLVRDRTSEIENLNTALMSTNKDLEKSNEDLHGQKEELHSTLNDLKLTQEQLIREEKMSSLGVLTSGIAHEINNSLNLIGGGMNQIKLEMQDAKNLSKEIRKEMENGLGWIDDGMKRVMGIVGGLSSYGQYRASIRKKSNLNELMESVISLHKTRMSGKIKLNVKLETPCEIDIYTDHLHKALLNILDNATYFTANSERKPKKKEIQVSTKELEDGENVSIEFRNFGDCIPEDIKSKIFDPFFTTKELGKGIGLGLTVAYSFVKRHNGKIEAINHKDGVSFLLTIPKEMKL